MAVSVIGISPLKFDRLDFLRNFIIFPTGKIFLSEAKKAEFEEALHHNFTVSQANVIWKL